MREQDHTSGRGSKTAGDWKTRRADEMARMWRAVIVATLTLCAVWAATMGVASYMLIRDFIDWQKALPRGVPTTIEQIVRDRPELLLISFAGGAAALLLMVAGLVLLRSILGRDNWAPTKVILIVTSLPVLLTILAAVTCGMENPTTTMLVMPLMTGYALSMIPLELGMLAAGLLRLSLRQLRQVPTAVSEDDLPADVAAFFARHTGAASEARLTRLGDFDYRPSFSKYRRFWIAPNGAYLVEATRAAIGQSSIEAICIFSATSDGRYFETVDHEGDLGQRVPVSDKLIANIEQMPGASLDELIERHIQLVTSWVAESSCRPLEFTAEDLHALSDYGIAAHLSETQNALLWLGNPYLGQPLPPLPGTPWHPQQETQPTPVAS